MRRRHDTAFKARDGLEAMRMEHVTEGFALATCSRVGTLQRKTLRDDLSLKPAPGKREVVGYGRNQSTDSSSKVIRHPSERASVRSNRSYRALNEARDYIGVGAEGGEPAATTSVSFLNFVIVGFSYSSFFVSFFSSSFFTAITSTLNRYFSSLYSINVFFFRSA